MGQVQNQELDGSRGWVLQLREAEQRDVREQHEWNKHCSRAPLERWQGKRNSGLEIFLVLQTSYQEHQHCCRSSSTLKVLKTTLELGSFFGMYQLSGVLFLVECYLRWLKWKSGMKNLVWYSTKFLAVTKILKLLICKQ